MRHEEQGRTDLVSNNSSGFWAFSKFTIDVRGVVKLGFRATDQRVLCALRVYLVRIDH